MHPPSTLNELIRNRWSPRAFSDRPVDHRHFREACLRPHAGPLRALTSSPGGSSWPTKRTRRSSSGFWGPWCRRTRNGRKPPGRWRFRPGKRRFPITARPDRFGMHDTGAALANLMIQATAVGLHVHAMGGFDAAKAREDFGIPEDFEVGGGFRDRVLAGRSETPAERSRRPLGEIGLWDRAGE